MFDIKNNLHWLVEWIVNGIFAVLYFLPTFRLHHGKATDLQRQTQEAEN